MDRLIYPVLREEVQRKCPNVISQDTIIEDAFSTYRSLRRGASTAEAQNSKITKPVIEAHNRWRKHARWNGTAQGMSMMDRYTDAKALSALTLIRFSYNLG